MIVFNIKKCTKCKKEKSILLFNLSRTNKFGVTCWCKECESKIRKKRVKDNPEKEKERHKRYQAKHKDKIKEYYLQYYFKNKDKYKERNKQWFVKNRTEFREYERNKRKTDSCFRIKQALRRRLCHVLKGTTKSASTLELLGCSIQEFKDHLEKQFTKGMTWDNYGTKGWHIDHIKPCDSFDLTLEKEQRKCFHYTNLQPLWAKDNLSKSNKII